MYAGKIIGRILVETFMAGTSLVLKVTIATCSAEASAAGRARAVVRGYRGSLPDAVLVQPAVQVIARVSENCEHTGPEGS